MGRMKGGIHFFLVQDRMYFAPFIRPSRPIDPQSIPSENRQKLHFFKQILMYVLDGFNTRCRKLGWDYCLDKVHMATWSVIGKAAQKALHL